MGRVYIITIFVNLIVSKSRSSPYDVPDVALNRKKLSFSANIKLYNFGETANLLGVCVKTHSNSKTSRTPSYCSDVGQKVTTNTARGIF